MLCCVSGTVDRHVRPNSGRSTINTVTVTHKFPLFWGLYPKVGKRPELGEHIVGRKRYVLWADMVW